MLPCVLCCCVLQTGWPELSPGVGSWLVQVVRFIILLAQAVPISLYVSLETVKVAQCKVRLGSPDGSAHMHWDQGLVAVSMVFFQFQSSMTTGSMLLHRCVRCRLLVVSAGVLAASAHRRQQEVPQAASALYVYLATPMLPHGYPLPAL